MTAGYTFGPCDRCETPRPLEEIAGEWLCPRCAARTRPPAPIAGQLDLDGTPSTSTQIGPSDSWPDGFF